MTSRHNFKYYNDFLLLHVFFVLVCIPTAGKLIDVWNIPLSAASLYFPFVYIVADVLTEVYGYAAARRVVWYGVIAQVAATLIFSLVALYPPASSFTHNDAYYTVLSTAPQLVLFGTIAVFLGDMSNNYVLARMKVLTGGRAEGLRFVLSTVVGQGVNTAFFYTFGLWGLLSSSFLFQSILYLCLRDRAVINGPRPLAIGLVDRIVFGSLRLRSCTFQQQVRKDELILFSFAGGKHFLNHGH